MKIKNSEEIEKFCKYCEYASSLATEDEMVCKKKGVVSAGYICRKFIYDPLKREPKKLKTAPTAEFEFPDIGI